MLARWQGRRVLTRTAWPAPVLRRNLGEMIGTLGYVTAIATLPFATVAAVFRAMPLAVTLGAALFLQEAVGSARRVFAILIAIAFFGEYPDAATLTGAALIIASGLSAFARESLRKHGLSLICAPR